MIKCSQVLVQIHDLRLLIHAFQNIPYFSEPSSEEEAELIKQVSIKMNSSFKRFLR